jgi:hypothetical protein
MPGHNNTIPDIPLVVTHWGPESLGEVRCAPLHRPIFS